MLFFSSLCPHLFLSLQTSVLSCDFQRHGDQVNATSIMSATSYTTSPSRSSTSQSAARLGLMRSKYATAGVATRRPVPTRKTALVDARSQPSVSPKLASDAEFLAAAAKDRHAKSHEIGRVNAYVAPATESTRPPGEITAHSSFLVLTHDAAPSTSFWVPNFSSSNPNATVLQQDLTAEAERVVLEQKTTGNHDLDSVPHTNSRRPLVAFHDLPHNVLQGIFHAVQSIG